jgi:hypothetical protein
MTAANRKTAVAKRRAASERKPAQPQAAAENTTPGAVEAGKDSAYKRLRRAVGKEVSGQSEMIAKSLVESTLAGNSSCARIVVSLVDKKKRTSSEQKKLKKAALDSKPVRTTAMNLADDALWENEDEAKPSPRPGANPGASPKKGSDADESH